MSAITGRGEPLTISFNASAASWSGTAGLTSSQPASFSSWIWRSVALTSRVSVLVIVCTAMGAAPPMTTPPTLTGIALRLVTMLTSLPQSRELPRRDALNVQKADEGGEREQRDQAPALEVQLHRAVEWAPAQHLDEDHDHATAVEGEQGKQVGETERHRQQGHDQDVGRPARRDRLRRHVGDPDRPREPVRPQQAALDLARDEHAQALHDVHDSGKREADPVRHGLLPADQLPRHPDSDRADAAGGARRCHDVAERPAVGMDTGDLQWRALVGVLLLPDEPGARERLAVDRLDAVAALESGRSRGRARDHVEHLAGVGVEL